MPSRHYFVVPTGEDAGPGTIECPFASLARAQQAVRASTAQMETDIVVNLRAGTYFLTAPFHLLGSAGDSGAGGHRVIYQPFGYGTADQEAVTLSGGRTITGWEQVDPNSGIWRAMVGDLETRQLYVNGRRARRATRAGGFPGQLTRTESGYTTDSDEPQEWANPSDIELVFTGVYPWSEARLQVAGIAGDAAATTITLAQPAWDWAGRLYNSVLGWESAETAAWAAAGGSLAAPSALENSLSFLTEPGCFVLDRTRPGQHFLHYRPRPDEDLTQASVVAPVLETLVRGDGADDHPLRNISFRGLTFADATWLRPSRPEGFLHYHGNTFYDGGPIQTVTFGDNDESSATVPGGEAAVMPANLTFSHTAGIEIVGCRFTRLGATALEFSGGSVETAIRGNEFSDISGGGLAIGANAPAAEADANRDNRIEQNWLHHLGCDYHGSPALLLNGPQAAIVDRNQINDVPHCGIVLYGRETTRDNQITRNLVFNSMQTLADGGGIYLSGRQGMSYASGTLVRGNLIRDVITSYNIGLYTDYGSAWVTVQANIIVRADTPIVLQVWPPLDQVAFIGNFWDTEPADLDAPPPTVIVAGNIRLTDEIVAAGLASNPVTADIVTRAGLSSEFRHLFVPNHVIE